MNGILPDQEVLRLVVLNTPVSELTAVFNYAFHNLSSARLTTAELQVLGLGHKFVPVDHGPSAEQLGRSVQQFARRVYLRDFFAQAGTGRGIESIPPDVRLRVRSPDWHPLSDGTIDGQPYEPSPGIQEFLDETENLLTASLARVRQIRVADNLTLSQRQAIKSLRENVDLVVAESDKNKGLCIMDASAYKALGERILAASAVEVTYADFASTGPDTTPAQLDAAIVDSVRTKLQAVLSQYGGLIDSWRGTSYEWKRKFLLRAVNRNPDTGAAYRTPNLRQMPKIGKDSARDVAGVHVAIGQPFALLDSVQLAPAVKRLPHFLQDSDTLTRDLDQLRLRATSCFLSIDIVRLYPSFDLERVLSAVEKFCLDSLPATAGANAVAEVHLDSALRRVCLLDNFCYFGSKYYKFIRGFPTGIASGRELAEIYLHVIESPVLARHATELNYCRRYVDDLFAAANCDRHRLHIIAAEYQAALATHGLDITIEIHETSAVMLDQQITKLPSGRLDLSVYQKPMSAYLYIPAHSDHAQHILRAWVKGELIRYIKRSSCIDNYLTTREYFIDRLMRRGYTAQFLQPIFDSVVYASRRPFLHHHEDGPKTNRSLRAARVGDESDPPLVLALTLPHTQRLDALGVQDALFSASQQWLADNTRIPEEIRRARFILARRTAGKLAAQLIAYRFPRERPTMSL